MQLGLEQIGIILAVFSVFIGVILGIDQARDAKKARHAELFMEFQNLSLNSEFLENLTEINVNWTWTDVDDFWKKYGPETDPKAFAKFSMVGSYYDSMGILLKNKLIDIRIIPELMAISIRDFWAKVSTIVEELSKAMQRPNAFENIEYLYQQIQRMAKKRDLTTN